MTTININDYCLNPDKYKSSIPKNVIDYYNQICISRKQLSKHVTKIDKLGNATGEAITQFIEGLLSPQGLAMISITEGVLFSVKFAYSVAVKWLTQGINDGIIKAAQEIVDEGVSEAVANCAAMLSSFIADLTIDSLGDSLAYAVGVLLQAIPVIGEILETIMLVQFLLQLIGMIFDSWDPCHLNDQLDDKTLRLFNTEFNRVFRENMLISLDTVVNSFGEPYIIYVWPIEFYADRSVTAKEKEDYYGPIRTKLIARYLNSLRTNSLGQKICWPAGGKLINNNILSKLSKTFAISASDGNTVIAVWVYRWWPLLILAILTIVFIFLIIRARKLKSI